jgi:hypothetical protein
MTSSSTSAPTAVAAMIWPRVPRVFLPSRWAFIASWWPERPAATAMDSSSQPSVQCHQVISRPVRRPTPRSAYHTVLSAYSGERSPW